MAAEIVILSGARRNERFTLDARAFQVGSHADCDVFLDPQRDPSIAGRSAKFCLQDGGWYVRCVGGEMWIKNRPVAGATHVRSGDVIRMSESGPDFSFNIVAAATKSPPPSLGNDANAANEPSPRAASKSAATGLELVPNEARGTMAFDRRWALWIAGGVAAGLLILLVVRTVFSPVVNVTIQQPAAPPIAASDSASGKAAPDGKKQEVASENDRDRHTTHADEPKKLSTPEPSAADLSARLDESVYLVMVEKADRFWPFVTCVAVGKDTLLTTAREAAQLAQWQDEGMFKIWVTRPADDLKFRYKAEARDIRVMAPFAMLPEKSPDLFYVDIGLVTVKEPLPSFAQLASAKELDEVEEGLPIACFGFTHEGHKLTRFDKLNTRLTSGKVFGIEIAQKLSGQPKRLHIQAEMPQNAYGNLVVNKAGKIIGVYGDAIPESDSHGLKNLHLATMVTPDIIDLWLRDRSNAKIWVPALPVSTIPKTHEQP
jgi:hypothetical protein